MKVLKGKIEIGNYKNMSLLVDWDYLRVERGLRKEEDSLQLVLGNLLQLVSVFVVIILFIVKLSLGEFVFIEILNADSLFDFVYVFNLLLLCYSFYLKRDRNDFYDTLDLKALTELRTNIAKNKVPSQIEVLDYIDYDVLNILDKLLASNDTHIYPRILEELVQLREVDRLLSRLGLTRENVLANLNKYPVDVEGDKSFEINKLLYQSFIVAYEYGFSFIGEWVVFLELALDEYKKLFSDLGVSSDTLMALLEWGKTQAITNRYKKLWKWRASLKPKSRLNRSYTAGYTPTLNKYSKDLTMQVLQSNFSYAIAREEEISEILRLMRQKNNPAVIILGEEGIGKSTVLKSIASRMVVEDVSDEFKDKRLVEFDFERAINASKSTNELRTMIDNIFVEVKKAGNIILVIDDIELLVNVRNEISAEIIATIVDALEDTKIRVIATSTITGYNRAIKPNDKLANLFDAVYLDEPSPEVALQILLDERVRIERKYNIKLQFDALKAAVELTEKYDSTRRLPFKALDTLEDACAYALEHNLTFVSAKEVEQVVSKEAGIKVGRMDKKEKEQLVGLEEAMHKRVVGQDKAIEAVANALRRARAGLAGGNRPVASFLFFGPTGVGKTEVARTLTDVYFGDEKLITRLDMSEFHEDRNIPRLIGYEEGNEFKGGLLTEGVRQHPFSLVLLDEMEKAHPQVLDLFLQILDEGHITDGIGRKVDFKNTIIIATSNVGSKKIAECIEQGCTYEETFALANEELKKTFRIEFINRFDKVIMFKPLSAVEIEKIAEIMLKKVADKLADQGIEVSFSSKYISEIAQKGYSKVFGARELRRVIQDEVEDKVAKMIVEGRVERGGNVKF